MGGLALDGLDPTQVATHAEEWEKVVRKLRMRVMPPWARAAGRGHARR